MNSEPLTCPIPGCKRKYTKEKNLRRHLSALHNNFAKYQCEYCSKTLSCKQNLREHTYLHTGEKPYVCTQIGCGAVFRQGSQLSAHHKQHRQAFKRPPIVEIRDLKVTIRQLSQLIARNPEFLSDKPEVPKLSLTELQVVMTPIRGIRNLGPLPSLFGN